MGSPSDSWNVTIGEALVERTAFLTTNIFCFPLAKLHVLEISDTDLALLPLVRGSAEMEEKPFVTHFFCNSPSFHLFVFLYPAYCSSKHLSLCYWFVTLVFHYISSMRSRSLPALFTAFFTSRIVGWHRVGSR